MKLNSFTVHYNNIQLVAIKMFKISKNIDLTIINDTFARYHDIYNLRYKFNLVVPDVCTIHNG